MVAQTDESKRSVLLPLPPDNPASGGRFRLLPLPSLLPQTAGMNATATTSSVSPLTSGHALQVYGLRQCDSVKKGLAALQARGIACQLHDFKQQGLPRALLEDWMQTLGDEAWPTLLNRQGTTWRRLSAQQQAAAAGLQGARELMLEQPSLVKRPVVRWPDGSLSIGLPALLQRLA